MSLLDTVRHEEQSAIEYIRNKDCEIMTTIQIEENRQRFIDIQKERLRRDGRQR